ncbi:MAG: ADP compounds hydrolase NudE [Kangiellaceae bacterium]|nr:ADP compounds hydrolase NudE [Kangiellaceae bacterium]
MNKKSKKLSKPSIVRRQNIAKTRLFNIEEIDLEFDNGEKRTYERLVAGPNGAVMIVPILENNNLLLIREYSAGTDNYQLAFPKGLMEIGESVEEAANRELKEEIGYGAKRFLAMKQMTLAPGYLTHKMNLVLAEDLFPESLVGDEPEPLEIVQWPIDDIDGILKQDDFTEARSIAALLLAKKIIENRN